MWISLIYGVFHHFLQQHNRFAYFFQIWNCLVSRSQKYCTWQVTLLHLLIFFSSPQYDPLILDFFLITLTEESCVSTAEHTRTLYTVCNTTPPLKAFVTLKPPVATSSCVSLRVSTFCFLASDSRFPVQPQKSRPPPPRQLCILFLTHANLAGCTSQLNTDPVSPS